MTKDEFEAVWRNQIDIRSVLLRLTHFLDMFIRLFVLAQDEEQSGIQLLSDNGCLFVANYVEVSFECPGEDGFVNSPPCGAHIH